MTFEIEVENLLEVNSPPRLTKIRPPRFFVEHLLQRLNGVDAPKHYCCLLVALCSRYLCHVMLFGMM